MVNRLFRFFVYTGVLVFLLPGLSHGQVSNVKFGKNRVQYHRFFDEWSQYESNNFVAYWYGESRITGQAVVQLAEYDYTDIQNLLECRVSGKIQIIVYADITDLQQSNIGSEEAFTTTAGQTKTLGNKIFVHFNGSHQDLRRQIREGIAGVYINALLFGSNLQEIVQNAVLLNLPAWFKEGITAYAGEYWSVELDNELRDVMLHKKYKGFQRLASQNPRLAGHAMWYYLSEMYQPGVISNLIYLTRINRSVESAMLYALNASYDELITGFDTYFQQRYQSDQTVFSAPTQGTSVSLRKKKQEPGQARLSPDGQQLAYVQYNDGRFTVWTYNISTGKTRKVLQKGIKNEVQAHDNNYPLLAWNPNGQELSIVYELRDVIRFYNYDLLKKKGKEETIPTEFQRWYSFDYVNPGMVVASAAVRGSGDLFLYYPANRQSQRLTNDVYDDMDPVFTKIRDRKGILFASNRPDTLLRPVRLDTVLPINNFDLFYYNLDTKLPELVRITNTPGIEERYPVPIDTSFYAYLSNESGIINRSTGYLEDYLDRTEQVLILKDGTEQIIPLDSVITALDTALVDSVFQREIWKERGVNRGLTAYDRNIVQHTTNPRTQSLVEWYVRDRKYKLQTRPFPTDSTLSFSKAVSIINPTPGSQYRNNPHPDKPVRVVIQEDTPEEEPPLLPSFSLLKQPYSDSVSVPEDRKYWFQSRFSSKAAVDSTELASNEEGSSLRTDSPRPATLVSKPAPLPTIFHDGKELYRFRSSSIIPYRLKFRTDYITTQMDNSLLFEGLQSFAASPEQFLFPEPGLLIKANVKDLLEDYEIEGGVRLSTSFNGLEYFVNFNNKKHRLDQTWSVYGHNKRYNTTVAFTPRREEVRILLGQYGVRYPFDAFRSVRAVATLREDRTIQLATDITSYSRPVETQERAGLKLEYIFDNTTDFDLNMRSGMRYKVYGDVMKRFDLDVSDGLGLSFREGALGVVGLDGRFYYRFMKHGIAGVRVAGATSFGAEKFLYYLGGVDNTLFPSFNQLINPAQSNFAFQTIAANVRGFEANARNGNSYGLVNTEARVAPFKYLSHRIRSNFIKNMQFVGFFDVGTAWEGLNPFSVDNPLNVAEIQNGSITVRVNYFRDPIIMGYGAGIRTLLFGYFVRVDRAWGIETREVQDPRWHLSVGMDF